MLFHLQCICDLLHLICSSSPVLHFLILLFYLYPEDQPSNLPAPGSHGVAALGLFMEPLEDRAAVAMFSIHFTAPPSKHALWSLKA